MGHPAGGSRGGSGGGSGRQRRGLGPPGSRSSRSRRRTRRSWRRPEEEHRHHPQEEGDEEQRRRAGTLVEDERPRWRETRSPALRYAKHRGQDATSGQPEPPPHSASPHHATRCAGVRSTSSPAKVAPVVEMSRTRAKQPMSDAGPVEGDHLVGLRPPLHPAALPLLLHQHLHHATRPRACVDLQLDAALQLDQPLEPRLATSSGTNCSAGQPGRGRAVARGVLVHEGVVEADPAHQLERGLVLLLRLPREGHDDVGGERDRRGSPRAPTRSSPGTRSTV